MTHKMRSRCSRLATLERRALDVQHDSDDRELSRCSLQIVGWLAWRLIPIPQRAIVVDIPPAEYETNYYHQPRPKHPVPTPTRT